MEITVNNIKYVQKKGILLNGDFMDKNAFVNYFQNTLLNNSSYRHSLSYLQRMGHIAEKLIDQLEAGVNPSKISLNLGILGERFTDFLGTSFGGEIALASVFQLNSKEEGKGVKIFYLDKQEKIRNAVYNYENKLTKFKEKIDGLIDYSEKLNKHLEEFYFQLTQPLNKIQTYQEYSKMRTWIYNNLSKERFKEGKKLKRFNSTFVQHFYGKTQTQRGYVTESFFAHQVLFHKGIDSQSVKETVISEMGGAGNENLFKLLASSKGNITGILGGDIIVIDKNGNIVYNIQSKATVKNSYSFQLSLKSFLQDMMEFIAIYKKYYNNKTISQIAEEDAEKMFNFFAADVWVEERANLLMEKGLDKIFDK